MDFFVAAHGIVEGFFVAGEGRWVEDDEVVFGFCFFEEIEDIGLDDLHFQMISGGIGAGAIAGWT